MMFQDASGSVVNVHATHTLYYTTVQLVYAEDGAESLKRMYGADDLKPVDLKAASPTQAAEGEAKLDNLGASLRYIFSRSEPSSP
jgi:hypothetical protein